LRREIMTANGWSLRDLYRTLDPPGANRVPDARAALDSAVRIAYCTQENENMLDFLLGLSLGFLGKEAKVASTGGAWPQCQRPSRKS
jgi:hypothetical protein